jgi:hypothetical protein
MAELRAPVTRFPAPVPPTRPEYIRDVIAGGDIGVVQKPLTVFQRLANQGWLRKTVILVVIAVAWEAYAQRLNNPLLVPTFSATIEAFWGGIVSGDIPQKMSNSVQLLLKGYALGLALAMTLTALAIMSRIGTDLLETLTSAFNPLPAIALLPLALVWFGLGEVSIIFVLVHSVLWAVALNTHSGFRSVSPTLRMVGRNYGLKGPRLVAKILIPALESTNGELIGDIVVQHSDLKGGIIEGAMTAALIDVSPGKGAFVVETAHGRIEVIGTRFVVDAERDRTTAAVVRGEVKLATPDGDVVLHAGEQAVAEPGRPPVRGPAPRLSHLASWAREARHRDELAVEPVHHGTLFARDPGVRSHPPWGPEYPLPIARLGLDVVVEDQVARVALDQTFHNAADQALEGVYRFAIPPDAALQRLAMYVDGKLTESGVVERMAARRIYEELVYRRVDPALLEWAGTGRLALRVYPIPARQDKRLMVAYTQSLPKLYSDWTLSVPLPEVDQPVGTLDVSVRVKGCAGCELSSTSHRIEIARDGVP